MQLGTNTTPAVIPQVPWRNIFNHVPGVLLMHSLCQLSSDCSKTGESLLLSLRCLLLTSRMHSVQSIVQSRASSSQVLPKKGHSTSSVHGPGN